MKNAGKYRYCENTENQRMTEAKSTHTVRRGRIFPEIHWTEEQNLFYPQSKPDNVVATHFYSPIG
ncbi:hypothetical protein DP114_18590 [Brasilonema sennae CENA114]|uniref:Uncharacterized protein n=2 Tax=Brasilonema TaxID=383614 RepID=A0A856MEK9_9CYAN|nr:hypothetical protein [Brasilonema octagenarum UFV-OR1]QDL09633.1 hypothetical protein DP114_18590 [Brasilonema sennae CENA114]